MPTSDWIRKLYEYNEWANARLLDVASGLSDAQLREDQAGIETIADTLPAACRAGAARVVVLLDRYRTGPAARAARGGSHGRAQRVVSQLAR